MIMCTNAMQTLISEAITARLLGSRKTTHPFERTRRAKVSNCFRITAALVGVATPNPWPAHAMGYKSTMEIIKSNLVDLPCQRTHQSNSLVFTPGRPRERSLLIYICCIECGGALRRNLFQFKCLFAYVGMWMWSNGGYKSTPSHPEQ